MVYESIKGLEAERRCWRQVGGVLVERKIGEVLPNLKQMVENVFKAPHSMKKGSILGPKHLEFHLNFGFFLLD